MADLTPEERQRIYMEEKARLEVRRELEGKKTSPGKVIGIVTLCIVGLLVSLFILGNIRQHLDDAAQEKLTPEARHAQTLENCAKAIELFKFKTYSELSEYDRRMLAACTEQLKHPDQNIFTTEP
ncbi:MAG TPA: hypothetical protein VEU96_12175 [Bryobacteraceae bacterium]|nr:hypothetical protein [Bryobacteraceae bacterium]